MFSNTDFIVHDLPIGVSINVFIYIYIYIYICFLEMVYYRLHIILHDLPDIQRDI